jgi:hypothetical protein
MWKRQENLQLILLLCCSGLYMYEAMLGSSGSGVNQSFGRQLYTHGRREPMLAILFTQAGMSFPHNS